MDFLTFLSLVAIAGSPFAIGYLFRSIAAAIAPSSIARVLRTAPLTASFGMFVVMLYIAVALLAPVIAPYNEREVLGGQYAPWDSTFLLGTDSLGRDMLSRLIYGARNTVGIALATTALAFAIGSTLGFLAATVGKWLDQALSRFVDVLISIPALILALLLLTIFGTSILTLILVIAVVDASRVYRLARAVVCDIVVTEYIEAARLRGERLWRLMWREILPNAKAPLVAEFGLRFCFVFLSISSLSFLGLGIQPPMADWGSMVRENAVLITFGDITPLLPAGLIALLTVSVNFIVDWMLHRSSGLKD